MENIASRFTSAFFRKQPLRWGRFRGPGVLWGVLWLYRSEAKRGCFNAAVCNCEEMPVSLVVVVLAQFCL